MIKNTLFILLRIAIATMFVLLCSQSFSQEKINIPLQYYISSHPESQLYLLIQCSTNKLQNIEKELDIHIKPLNQDWFKTHIQANKVKKLAGFPEVKSIYFNATGLVPLSNDTMRKNNHVFGAYNGTQPLNRSYKGKGVLMGFIDTGVEIRHPDLMNADSSTRIVEIWDQAVTYDGKNKYGYGHLWDSTEINDGICTHQDPANEYGHGTQVTGAATSDGNATGNFIGIAPEADIAVVATDFSAQNWGATFIDAVQHLFHLADSLYEPCVVNASLGSYSGSHDGTDPVSLAIDSMLKAKDGRVLVGAAGNAGNIPYHLHTDLNIDTAITWFKYNSNSVLGKGAMFFELWADTGNFNQVQYAFALDQHIPHFVQRAMTPFQNIQNHLNQNSFYTLTNSYGNILGVVQTYAERQGGKYLLQVSVVQPDSLQYHLRLETIGTGKFDVWSGSFMGFSDMINSNLPKSSLFPIFQYYNLPDTNQTMVSSFQCSPSVITVANYNNRNTYLDYDSVVQNMGIVKGAIAATSSRGPTRTGLMKPDIASSGGITFNCSRLASLASMRNSQAFKLSLDGMHQRNGGTSLASPIVAGAAGLLLEKCAHLTFQQIINILTSTTYQDQYTGNNLPDNRWGYGKLNIFDALVKTNFSIDLQPTGSKSICEGTKLFINTNSTFNSYDWSSGDTSQTILADKAGNYFVTVKNAEGCSSTSDTLRLLLNPKPVPPPIWFVNKEFHTSTYMGQIQWYKDIMPIGTNDTILSYSGDGSYFVSRIDSNGCVASSDIIQLSLGIADMENNKFFKIFPQPADHYVIIQNEIEENGVFIIRNMLGQKIFSIKIHGKEKTRVNLQKYSTGMYFYEFKNNSSRMNSGKLIIYK